MSVKEILQMYFPKLEDNKLNFIIAKAENAVKEYCNIDTIPEALYFTIADIAAKFACMYNWIEDSDSNITSSTNTSEIASIKEGDTTITYNVAAKTSSSDSSLLSSDGLTEDRILEGFESTLNRYRKLRW